jgi:hypothetical protein
MGEAPGGWLLFLSRNLDDAFKGRLLRLTALGPAVACVVEEHVMYSEARGYEAGREIWRASHNSEKGIYNLDASGDLPAFFARVRDELREQQDEAGGEDADVDLIFDIPQRLAREICGFQLGEEEPAGFRDSELRKAKASAAGGDRSGGFLSRLFGRR